MQWPLVKALKKKIFQVMLSTSKLNYLSILTSYYLVSISSELSSSFFRKWPELSPTYKGCGGLQNSSIPKSRSPKISWERERERERERESHRKSQKECHRVLQKQRERERESTWYVTGTWSAAAGGGVVMVTAGPGCLECGIRDTGAPTGKFVFPAIIFMS